MEDVEKFKQLISPLLKRYLIKRAAIFGSFATGTANAGSDIDLLIEPGKDFSLFKMLALEPEISDLVKRKVDLVEYGAIKRSLTNEVLSTAVPIL